jgi:murein peptide amidase A
MNKLSALFIIAGLFFSGCAVLQKTKEPESILTYAAGTSIQGREIECSILGNGHEVIMFIAAIHGNEPAGTPLLEKLGQYLKENTKLLKDRTVIIVPTVNPDGLASYSRSNANGIDLNRNFPARNRINDANFGNESLSEPESRTVNELIEKYKPNRIVSCHQPEKVGTGWIDFDGPGEDLAKRFSQYCILPLRKFGALPGSLGSYAGQELGLPIITFEIPINIEGLDSRQLWQKYGLALLATINYPNEIEKDLIAK